MEKADLRKVQQNLLLSLLYRKPASKEREKEGDNLASRP